MRRLLARQAACCGRPRFRQRSDLDSASAAARPLLENAAKQLGVAAYALAKAPAGAAVKLKPIRIGLYDQYGGLMTSGWIRWLFEQDEFPFELVYPQALDAGDLRARFDVLVFSDGAFRRSPIERGPESPSGSPKPEEIPAEFRPWLGHITAEKTLPQIQKFLAGGRFRCQHRQFDGHGRTAGHSPRKSLNRNG